jgi:hypothetical protein
VTSGNTTSNGMETVLYRHYMPITGAYRDQVIPSSNVRSYDSATRMSYDNQNCTPIQIIQYNNALVGVMGMPARVP